MVRVLQAVLSMLAVLVLVFVLARLTGDPARFLLPPEARAEDRARVTAEFGLDQPVWVQFLKYVEGVATGDLGESFRLRTPVSELIADRAPATILLGSVAVLLTVAVAIPLGVYAGYARGGVVDRATRAFAGVGQAMPPFWLGLLLLLLFSVHLGWLPAGGVGGIDHLILPSVTLALGAIAGLVRLLRSSMIEELGSDYVAFLRMKGLPESRVVLKHGLRNAGLTSITYIGLLTAGFLTGSVLVENVFNWPGIGRLLVEGIHFRDFNIVQGTLIVLAFIYIVVNMLVDILYTILNPRLR